MNALAGSALRVLTGLALVAFATACVPLRGGWDTATLGAAVPPGGHRLGDLAPHFLPPAAIVGEGGQASDVWSLFLCRWPTDAPIPVILPTDAGPDEVALLRRALAMWASSGLSVRFIESDDAVAGIAFRFVSEGDRGPLPAGAGDTLVECRVDAGPADGLVAARLVSASVWLRRDQIDLVGRAVPIDADARLGAAIHEVGHALGFSSHVAVGDSVMRSSPEIARRFGREAQAGGFRGDPNLSALYSVPNGLVVGEVVVGQAVAAEFDAFIAAAQQRDLDGPYTRVGDRGARLYYRSAGLVPVALSVRPWPIGDVERIVVAPNPPARLLLERSAGSQAGRGR